MTKRELLFKWLNPFLVSFYVLFHMGWSVYYLTQRNIYYAVLSFCALLFLPAIPLVYRGLHFRPVYQLNAFIYLFLFLLYSLGLVMQFYTFVPHYDKAAHTLSGVFVSLLALICFYFLKPGHRIETSDYPMICVFTTAVSLAIAGLWEIAEYALSLAAGSDPQNVLTTGVQDTMLDMVVCTAGALFMLIPYHSYYQKKKAGFLLAGFEVMIQINLRRS